MAEILTLLSFGPEGWGQSLALAALVTVAVAATGFLIGIGLGALAAWGRIAGRPAARIAAGSYTTVLRGLPEILVVYLFYFGGSMGLTAAANALGHEGFTGVPPFLAGALAIGVVTGAYQAEVLRSAFRVLSPGEIEAARACGMGPWLMFRRIIAPQVLQHALPGIGNIWQMSLKESALISVTGLVELLRQAQIAAGSTRRPFEFYLIATGIYLLITWLSQILFELAEARSRRHLPEGR